MEQPDSQWRTKNDEVIQALEMARAIKFLAQKIQTIQDNDWGSFLSLGQKWEHEADLNIESFAFFIGCKGAVPAGYRFAGWINGPAILLAEIQQTMKSFDIDVEPLYQEPELPDTTGDMAQLALF